MTLTSIWLLFISSLISISSASAEFLTLNIRSQVYLLSNYSRTFAMAETQCDIYGGVIEFETNSEYFDVTNYLDIKFPNYGDIWVKINAKDTNNDGKYDSFSWKNETVNKAIWDIGEPNENCVNAIDECHVRLVTNQKLRDKPANYEFYFLCRAMNECAQTSANNCSHICIDLDLGFACSCRNGYVLDQDLATCKDVNECNGSPAPCSQYCNNTIGSYKCSCHSGFELGENGTCRDVDECNQTPSPCSQICNNTVGSYICGCYSGFYLASNETCVDVDECKQTPSPCSQICNNTVGSYICGCYSGFYLASNETCVDVDECKQTPSPCNEVCNNTIGSFSCGCRSGFQFDVNRTCVDIDECNGGTPLCDQICNNTAGSYVCTCRTGYAYDGGSNVCKDIDECQTSPCQTSCRNTEGSYDCECETGYIISSDGHSCEDQNECLLPVKICQQSCINTLGSYLCECHAGYTLDRKENSSCTDVDECVNKSVDCGGGNCVNTEGGFLCKCQEGYTLENNMCVDVDECLQVTSHACSQRCINTLGGYMCSCDDNYYLASDNVTCIPDPCATAECQHECMRKNASYVCACRSGYYLDLADRRTCHDLDECDLNSSLCEHVCNNTAGSYRCTCKQHYTLAADGHSCVTKLSRDHCPCSCSAHRFSALEALRTEILEDLRLDRKNLSSYLNSLKSREDRKQTSTTIGYCGITFLAVVFGLVIGSDILSVLKVIIAYCTRKKSVIKS